MSHETQPGSHRECWGHTAPSFSLGALEEPRGRMHTKGGRQCPSSLSVSGKIPILQVTAPKPNLHPHTQRHPHPHVDTQTHTCRKEDDVSKSKALPFPGIATL